jgi:ribosome-associated toxin RatA of RatAB toxin-antitoxin module
MSTSINRTALLSYSAKQIFDIVNDITSYPDYMNNCVGSEIIEQDKSFMIARLDLKKGFLQHSFTTHNALFEPEKISMTLEEGPFSKFRGEWVFKEIDKNSCKVSLDLEFEFNSFSIGLASNQLFASVANNLVDALSARAKEVYGL